MSPTIPSAQGVILLGAGVLGKRDPALPAPGEGVQAGVRGAAPAARVPLEVTGCWEERGTVVHPALPGGRWGSPQPLPSFQPSSGQEQGA